jgi:hypothetical protein
VLTAGGGGSFQGGDYLLVPSRRGQLGHFGAFGHVGLGGEGEAETRVYADVAGGGWDGHHKTPVEQFVALWIAA